MVTSGRTKSENSVPKNEKKLFNGCYENHLRKDCNSNKVSWAEYVRSFKHSNPEFQDLFYGKWSDLSKTTMKNCPPEKDFNIPAKEWEEMKKMLSQCRVDEENAKLIFKERLLIYKLAMRDFNSGSDTTSDQNLMQ